MEIRNYTPKDYHSIKEPYINSGWFDELIDSEQVLNNQSENNPESIIVAEENGTIVGSVTLLATGRLALLFRLISEDEAIRSALLDKGLDYFISKGYKRIDIVALEEDGNRHLEYEGYGFTKGNLYRWFWKEVK